MIPEEASRNPKENKEATLLKKHWCSFVLKYGSEIVEKAIVLGAFVIQGTLGEPSEESGTPGAGDRKGGCRQPVQRKVNTP